MNPIDVISAIVEQLVVHNPALSTSIPYVPGWLDVGAPAPSSDSLTTYPCVRLDGLVNMTGKNNHYTINVKLWSQDTSSDFLSLAESMKAALASSNQLLCETYLHRPEGALNCALFPVTFYA